MRKIDEIDCGDGDLKDFVGNTSAMIDKWTLNNDHNDDERSGNLAEKGRGKRNALNIFSGFFLSQQWLMLLNKMKHYSKRLG